jgi:hypothetical protein
MCATSIRPSTAGSSSLPMRRPYRLLTTRLAVVKTNDSHYKKAGEDFSARRTANLLLGWGSGIGRASWAIVPTVVTLHPLLAPALHVIPFLLLVGIQ